MKEYNFIKDKFVKKHEEVDNEYYLDKYISLLLEYKLDGNDNEVYTEKHHILPRSTFPEYKNEDWNIVELSYEDHKLVHLWIFKAINILSYQRPLNWMFKNYKNTNEELNSYRRFWDILKNNEDKYNEYIDNQSTVAIEKQKELREDKDKYNEYIKNLSISHKKYWENLKTNDKEEYDNRIKVFLENRKYRLGVKRHYKKDRKYFYRPHLFDSESQRIKAKKFWDNITEEEYLAFSKKMKDYWTDEKRKEKSKEMNEYYMNPENVEKKRKETKERWDNMNDVDRENFKEKMSLINKDKDKRLDAGEKIKNKWKDPVYLDKMKNRKKRSGTKIKITKSNGVFEIFDNMQDVVRKYNFSLHLIRKYRNTNNKVLKEHLNNENIDLLGSIIETVK